MEQTIVALTTRIYNLGFNNVKFCEKTEEFLYFTASDSVGDPVEVKAEIDDEMQYDEWSIYQKEDYDNHWTVVE